ncbi:MAG TPA: bifunctional riboflavin kinase/FAD synthetase [Chloroflexota bacterium]|nr:bifunctional riboflavin kinase/FAD synthetase [Chloroflexota bacterium]
MTEPASPPAAQPAPAGARRPGVVAAIGAFDGLHRGHQVLLRDMVERAASLGARAVCVTFDPDPVQVLHPEVHPRALCSTAERERLIRALGVDEVYVWPFTPAVAQMSPEEFIADLCARYPLTEVWVGVDFGFGRDRAGNVQTLVELGQRYGFGVHARAPVYDGDRPISSTRIRDLLEAGEVAEAARLLGRPYRLAGEVLGGAQRGRQLGFPTANLVPPPEQVLPAHGVYAGLATVAGVEHPSVANVGSRPTFGEEQPLIEVHLLDFSGDLYGQHLAFDFVERVRTIRRFESMDALRAQISADIAGARACLARR